MSKFEIGDKVNFVVERSLLSGVITKFYKNPYGKEECSIKTEIKTFPHILLQRVKKVSDEDDLISKIANLEAKLAESEKSNEYFADRVEKADKEIKEIYKKYNKLVEEYNNLKEEVDNNFVDGQKYNELKQQLAEKEEQLNNLEQQCLICNKDQENERLKRQLAEVTKKYELASCPTGGLVDRARNLEQQLADKDRQIEQLKKFDNLNKTFFDLFRTAFKEPNKVDDLFNTLKTMQDKQDQDKISFAVDVLEEIADCSNYINSKLDFECGSYVSEKAIRDKIKYLKGKKDE